MARIEHPPAFQFYVKDFSGDGKVEAMTTEFVGAYILLLCKAWFEQPCGSVPDNDAILSRWTRMDMQSWLQAKPSVMAPFKLKTDGRWYQKRMCEEFAKLQRLRKTRREAAKIAADARHSKGRKDNNLDAERMRDACESDAQRIPLHLLSSISTPTTTTTTYKTTAHDAMGRWEEFQKAYPKQVAVEAALRFYLSEMPPDEGGQIALHEEIMAGLTRWKGSQSWANPQYIPNMDTFLGCPKYGKVPSRMYKDFPPQASEVKSYKPQRLTKVEEMLGLGGE